MKRGVCITTVALLSAATTVASAQRAEEAVDATRSIYSAIARADTLALRRLLAEDLRWVIGGNGAVATADQLLTAAGQPLPEIRVQYQLDSATTWERGVVIGVDYILTTRRTFREYETVFLSRGTDTYARDHGHLRLVRHMQTWVVRPPDTTSFDSLRLAPFVGRYDKGHGFIDDVHFHEGHLVAQSAYEALMGLPGAHLYPVSADTFSPEQSAPMIVFERDEGGRVIGYVQQQPDGTIARAPRLEAAAAPHSRHLLLQ